MSKVTNNENMRRYVHMKLSNGGSGSGSGGECTCLPPMMVEGDFDMNDSTKFVPNDGQATFDEAVVHFNSGGVVLLKCPLGGNTELFVCAVTVYYASSTNPENDYLEFMCEGDRCKWKRGGGGIPE